MSKLKAKKWTLLYTEISKLEKAAMQMSTLWRTAGQEKDMH